MSTAVNVEFLQRKYEGILICLDSLVFAWDVFDTHKDIAHRALTDNGIHQMLVGNWFPMFRVVNALKIIEQNFSYDTMFLFGLKMVDSFAIPPEINTLEQALQSVNWAYHLNHIKGGVYMYNPATGLTLDGIGSYTVAVKQEERIAVVMSQDIPYPAALCHGYISGISKVFKPNALITFENTTVDPISNIEYRTFKVTW